MNLDFTLTKYEQLCRTILDAGYTVWPIARYLSETDHSDRIVLLRHDIDRCLGNALQMARLEYELGVQATYYARMTASVFQPKILSEITNMGHELGYHYETLAKAKGDPNRAIAIFQNELNKFKEICHVQTISMHGAPLSRWDNRDLWQHYDFCRYDLLGEAYLSLDYTQLVYLTDTGRSWAGNRYNLRDKVDEASVITNLNSTDDLITAIANQQFSHVCISTHPERWSQNMGQWLVSATLDLVANQIKGGLALIRRVT